MSQDMPIGGGTLNHANIGKNLVVVANICMTLFVIANIMICAFCVWDLETAANFAGNLISVFSAVLALVSNFLFQCYWSGESAWSAW